MAARFHALRDKITAQVDHIFAEPVRLSFMNNGTLDPERAIVDIEAVLRTGGGKNTNVAGASARSWRTRVVAERGELHIDRATYAGSTPRVGDRVRATARPGAPWFEVLHVDDRGHTRLVLELGEA